MKDSKLQSLYRGRLLASVLAALVAGLNAYGFITAEQGAELTHAVTVFGSVIACVVAGVSKMRD